MLFLKIFLALIFWGVFIYVIFYIPYPDSLVVASPYQLFAFFVPLLIGLTLSIDFIFKKLSSSIILSLGIISLLVLKSLGALNLISLILILLALILLLSYFKPNLTYPEFMPKLKRRGRRK